jgi:hypothetical protein
MCQYGRTNQQQYKVNTVNIHTPVMRNIIHIDLFEPKHDCECSSLILEKKFKQMFTRKLYEYKFMFSYKAVHFTFHIDYDPRVNNKFFMNKSYLDSIFCQLNKFLTEYRVQITFAHIVYRAGHPTTTLTIAP